MFTINIYLKLAIIAVCLLGGIILTATISFWYALPFLLIGIGLLISYFLLGTVQSAAAFTQNSQFEEAEARLNLTLKPEWLYQTNRAFFYIIKGTLAMNRKDTVAAEMWLQKAEALDLPSDNEKAMVQLQLANIYASKGKWKAAENHMRNLKGMNITQIEIKEQVVQFEKMMLQSGQMKNGMRRQGKGMANQMGGKRRRPKMR